MEIHCIHPFGLKLPADSPFLREPCRPESLQDEAFREQFDYTTLIYDVFRSDCGQFAICICPPFFNLLEYVSQTKFFAIRRAEPQHKIPCLPTLIDFDRNAQIWLPLPEGADLLLLISPMGVWTLSIGANLSALFAGKNVLFTKQKNNPIQWIVDWVNLQVALNGINAVLIYDNLSTDYPVEELLGTLAARLMGVDVLALCHWPYPFGPTGGVSNLALLEVARREHGMEMVPWDSDFTNLSIPAAGRYRFLERASHVLWGDVDELVLAERGGTVFDLADQQDNGVLLFNGYTPLRVAAADGSLPLEKLAAPDLFKYPIATKLPSLGGTKWAVRQPGSLKAGSQLRVHDVVLADGTHLKQAQEGAKLRHFWPLSTGWKQKSRVGDCAKFDPVSMFLDCGLLKALHQASQNLYKYHYPLHEVLAFARSLGACPRPPAAPSPAPEDPAFDCSRCPYREGAEV